MADEMDVISLNVEEDDENKMEEGAEEPMKEQVFLPGDELEEDEELQMDESAYEMYHAGHTGAPCLSFDIIPNNAKHVNPQSQSTCYIVTGSQAESSAKNTMMVMKMSGLDKSMAKDSDSDDDDDIIPEEGDAPTMFTASYKHPGVINRVRRAPIGTQNLASTWSDNGTVYIWDISPLLTTVESSPSQKHTHVPANGKILFSFNGHQVEGYAMDWSRVTPGRLATGANNSSIHLWQMNESANFHVDQRPYKSHTDSVEDIQWSPSEANVFASCSVDKTVRVWDARAPGTSGCMITVEAHSSDVNVISWNKHEPFLLSGGDDGVLNIWDLRQLQSGKAVASFKHHTSPITSVEWHPTDASVFAASGADDQITLWDLAVETDRPQPLEDERLKNLPPQLLFIHMGQKEIKEVHWHPSMLGCVISTAHSGFNVFKTISV